MVSAIFDFWPDTIRITHNEIAACNGFGINVGWGATYDTTALKAPYVAFNRIHDTAIRAKDSGGIPAKSNSSGEIYTDNWIYNIYTLTSWDTGPENWKSSQVRSPRFHQAFLSD